MPYNTSAIPRPEEISGTSALPLARVKKIIAQDEDIAQCSNGAAFAISVATEEFLRYLTEQAYNVAKSESKPRKNIQYKDIAAAVSKLDNLQFLSDTVPRTVTYKQVKEKEKKAKDASDAANDAMNDDPNDTTANGDQTTTSKQRSIAHMMQKPGSHAHRNGTNGTANGQVGSAPASPPGQRISLSMANSPIVDRTVQNAHTHPPGDEDVEMEDQD
ncbi:hypothetical protein OHC33_010663 [Knufia fluminis]|uniref:Transcription factor CBF/NF-Y/archaeal histone domain-containing protein n=1 Tax=Knufia fluminis TaxID=191047 RepID=A0AAN8IHS0_9EURO|nr:hypothetical protein OHC33_010663 [Knufia fluminis]